VAAFEKQELPTADF